MNTTPDSAWLLEQIAEYEDAHMCGEDDRQKDVFLQVVNRCAQYSAWAELWANVAEKRPVRLQTDQPVSHTETSKP